MNATALDLRKNMKNILKALNRNEKITLTYRGRKKAIIIPCTDNDSRLSASQHLAFGMWSDKEDISNVDSYVRNLRKGRF